MSSVMAAKLFPPKFALPPPPPPPPSTPTTIKLTIHIRARTTPSSCWQRMTFPFLRVARTNMRWLAQSTSKVKDWEDEDDGYQLPKEYYDDEWQARQREKTKELHRRRQEEEEEENRKVAEYREIGSRLKGYPEEEVIKARKLVSIFIRSTEEVEEKIEEAAEKGELTELVLMVIWNRLDLARRDDEKDAIRSLDLLYRRVETEILKREATPSMNLLNDLLNLHDGFDDEEWLKKCRKHMVDTFPREDPFSILVPTGIDIDTHQGRIGLPSKEDDMLLRIDFIREVDELIKEVRSEQNKAQLAQGFDPESVATRLKQQEKQRILHQIDVLLDLAITLKW